MDWLASEVSGAYAAQHELRRLVRRALARKRLILVVTLGLTGAAILRQATKQGQFTAAVTFRIDENVSREAGQVARPAGELRDYVVETVLTHDRCQQIIKKHGLYPSAMRIDARLATEYLTDDLEVNVYRNYFIEEGLTHRSALLEVKYTHHDPDVAHAVVLDVAAMVREHQEREGRERAGALARWSTEVEKLARHDWEEVSRQYTQKLTAIGASRGLARAQLMTEAALLADGLSLASLRLQQAAELKERGTLWLSNEMQRMGLSFVMVDDERPQLPITPKLPRMLKLAALLFVILLPMVAAGAAGFLPYVLSGEDVERLGLKVVGHVPPYPGWDRGTLIARRRGERWEVGLRRGSP